MGVQEAIDAYLALAKTMFRETDLLSRFKSARTIKALIGNARFSGTALSDAIQTVVKGQSKKQTIVGYPGRFVQVVRLTPTRPPPFSCRPSSITTQTSVRWAVLERIHLRDTGSKPRADPLAILSRR
jgi:hypothetical protein